MTLIMSLAPEEVNGYDIIDLDDLNVDMTEENCQKVISGLINLVKYDYVYTDIANDPPNEEYYGTVNLTSELEAIETKNRKYYDFYRDIKRVINKLRDLHFLFKAKNCSEKINQINNIYMCMPFSLNVRGNSSDNAEMFIEKLEKCSVFYNVRDKEFIAKHLNSSLKKINGISPFDFIQNFSKGLLSIKSKHGTFNLMLHYFNFFNIYLIPLNKTESSNIKFTFDDNQNITLNYTVVYVNNNNNEEKNSLNNYNELGLKNNKEIKWNYSTNNTASFQCKS